MNPIPPRIRALRRRRLAVGILNCIACAAGASALLFILGYLIIMPAGRAFGVLP